MNPLQVKLLAGDLRAANNLYIYIYMYQQYIYIYICTYICIYTYWQSDFEQCRGFSCQIPEVLPGLAMHNAAPTQKPIPIGHCRRFFLAAWGPQHLRPTNALPCWQNQQSIGCLRCLISFNSQTLAPYTAKGNTSRLFAHPYTNA